MAEMPEDMQWVVGARIEGGTPHRPPFHAVDPSTVNEKGNAWAACRQNVPVYEDEPWEPEMVSGTFCSECITRVIPLHDRVMMWVQGEGHPLELKVARDLQAAGAVVENSVRYPSPTGGDHREVDVVATWMGGRWRHDPDSWHADFRFHFTCVVECKTLTEPVVGFVKSTPGRAKDWMAGEYLRSPSYARLFDELSPQTHRYPFALHDVHADRVAFLVRATLRSDSPDRAYKMVTDLVADSRALSAADAVEYPDERRFVLFFPLIVVRGQPLFMVELDEQSNELVMRETDHLVVLLSDTMPVHVVAYDYLGVFIDRLKLVMGDASDEILGHLIDHRDFFASPPG